VTVRARINFTAPQLCSNIIVIYADQVREHLRSPSSRSLSLSLSLLYSQTYTFGLAFCCSLCNSLSLNIIRFCYLCTCAL